MSGSIKIITIGELIKIIQRRGLENFLHELIERLKLNFSRWQEFRKTPRLATYYPQGVIELMPISDDQYYSFKYVNGHPENHRQKKLTVAALGLLAETASGYPVLISEMTLLTALRTAATAALASLYLAKPKPAVLAIIGTGAQAEFQILAHRFALNITKVRYYDQDPAAMAKFNRNLSEYDLELFAAGSAATAVTGADIVTTTTAGKHKAPILENHWILPGMHINAIGGCSPGETELDPQILTRGKIVVEFLPQTQREGEIQSLNDPNIYAELWEIVSGKKPGRQNKDDIFIFDSVGFALEDYTILRYIHDLSTEYKTGKTLDLLPHLSDPKDLFSLLVAEK